MLCFKKVTQEIFSELDETKAERPENYRSFQWTKEEMERGHRATTPQGGVAYPWPAPPGGEATLAHFWRRPFTYKDPPTGKT
jgi:hypothetical protein